MADNLVYLDYHAKHDNRTRRAGRNPCSHLPGGVAASWKAAGCCSVKERSCPHTGCGRRGRKNFVLALLTDTGTDTASASAQVTSVTKLNKNFPRRGTRESTGIERPPCRQKMATRAVHPQVRVKSDV